MANNTRNDQFGKTEGAEIAYANRANTAGTNQLSRLKSHLTDMTEQAKMLSKAKLSQSNVQTLKASTENSNNNLQQFYHNNRNSSTRLGGGEPILALEQQN